MSYPRGTSGRSVAPRPNVRNRYRSPGRPVVVRSLDEERGAAPSSGRNPSHSAVSSVTDRDGCSAVLACRQDVHDRPERPEERSRRRSWNECERRIDRNEIQKRRIRRSGRSLLYAEFGECDRRPFGSVAVSDDSHSGAELKPTDCSRVWNDWRNRRRYSRPSILGTRSPTAPVLGYLSRVMPRSVLRKSPFRVIGSDSPPGSFAYSTVPSGPIQRS